MVHAAECTSRGLKGMHPARLVGASDGIYDVLQASLLRPRALALLGCCT